MQTSTSGFNVSMPCLQIGAFVKLLRHEARFAEALRQACDAGFLPFDGSPPCRLERADGLSPEAISAVKFLSRELSELPRCLCLKKHLGLREELSKICTTKAGVVTWFDLARVFTSFNPLLAKQVVSEIWTFMAEGEELQLSLFFAFCLPGAGGKALPLVSPWSVTEETMRMARADLEANVAKLLREKQASEAKHKALQAEHEELVLLISFQGGSQCEQMMPVKEAPRRV
ncbi:PNO [Symbiodinium sp. CCMP2592]|nr:PNO [Symbiodinium sp. CCMP2592]